MESQVTCEVCGKYHINVENQDMMNFCHHMGIFACERCITSWAVLQKHLDLKILECQTQQDIDEIARIKSYLENLALSNLLKSNPMPVPATEEIKPIAKNRMDSIIMGDEEDGNRQ